MVEHLHSEAPFQRIDLLLDGLFGNFAAVVASVADLDIYPLSVMRPIRDDSESESYTHRL